MQEIEFQYIKKRATWFHEWISRKRSRKEMLGTRMTLDVHASVWRITKGDEK